MTSGMRRPPRLWEQKLEGMIRAAGVSGIGVPSSSVISPGPTPGPDGPGSEPAPPPVVDPDPATPRVPSTPVVAGTTLGLSITWDGKDSAGVLFPVGVIVEVHVSASTGFTPSSGTLKGTITEAGGSLLVGGIAAGSTFYVKFIAVYADGQKSDPSAQGSAQVGLVQGPEINGDAVITQIVAATTPVTTYKLGSIWLNTSNGTYNVLEDVGGTPTWVKREWDTAAIAANAITANQIAAQAITTKFLTGEIIRTGASPSARIEISAANGIEVFRDATNKTFWAKPSGEVVFGTTSVSSAGTTVIDGDSITTGSITGRLFQTTGAGTTRVTMAEATAAFGADAINFYSGGSRAASFYYVAGDGYNSISTDGRFTAGTAMRTFGPLYVGTTATIDGAAQLNSSATIESGLFAKSTAEFSGAYDLGTDTGADIILNTNKRLRRKSSTQRVKYDITPLSGTLLSGAVDAAKLSDVDTTGDLHKVLDVAVVEFSPITEGEPVADRYVGFIAEDVAEKFPAAIMFSPADGSPEAVRVDAVLAALLAVARDQRSLIADLSARVEALEG